MNKRQIETREQALLVLRQARDWVKAGHIREGRDTIGDMLLDAVQDSPRERHPHSCRIESLGLPVPSPCIRN